MTTLRSSAGKVEVLDGADRPIAAIYPTDTGIILVLVRPPRQREEPPRPFIVHSNLPGGLIDYEQPNPCVLTVTLL